ncbi:MAG: septal ring lytic transglycosylase RlpA family protein [Chitinophagaceae bacterium]
MHAYLKTFRLGNLCWLLLSVGLLLTHDVAARKQKKPKAKTNKQQNDSNYQPIGKPVTGIASFYSQGFNGRRTSSGEIFGNDKLTAASNHFKLGTWVRVVNLRNKKSVNVKVNDRMHKSMSRKGRIIDLSRAAAVKIGITGHGLAKVSVQAVKKPIIK